MAGMFPHSGECSPDSQLFVNSNAGINKLEIMGAAPPRLCVDTQEARTGCREGGGPSPTPCCFPSWHNPARNTRFRSAPQPPGRAASRAPTSTAPGRGHRPRLAAGDPRAQAPAQGWGWWGRCPRPSPPGTTTLLGVPSHGPRHGASPCQALRRRSGAFAPSSGSGIGGSGPPLSSWDGVPGNP